MECAAFRFDDPSPCLHRDLPRAMPAMLISAPKPDKMRRQSKSLASTAHERGGLGTERGEGGGLGELNGNSIFEWEGGRTGGRRRGNSYPFVSSASFFFFFSLPLSLVVLWRVSLSLCKISLVWGFCTLSVLHLFLSLSHSIKSTALIFNIFLFVFLLCL